MENQVSPQDRSYCIMLSLCTAVLLTGLLTALLYKKRGGGKGKAGIEILISPALCKNIKIRNNYSGEMKKVCRSRYFVLYCYR